MTIVAFGGGGLGVWNGRFTLFDHLLSLTGKEDPRVCFVGTASGDSPAGALMFYDVARLAGVRYPSHLTLFPYPNVRDVREHVLAQDLVYVGGGNTANMLAVWRVHGLDVVMREAWESGVVLAGTSAGSLCWFDGGTTDSYGLDLKPITDCLGFLPASHAPHYDSEERRRPLYQRLVREGVIGPGWGVDEGVGLVFEGTELTDVVSARQDDGAAWRVERDGETRVDPRRL
jgi:peptidase E